MSTQHELEKDDQVQILAGGPHDHIGRIATVSYFQENGDVVLYFGDQDEDEFVYSPNEITKVATNPEIGALDRVRALVEKWENVTELSNGRSSIITHAFAAEVRKALEGK